MIRRVLKIAFGFAFASTFLATPSQAQYFVQGSGRCIEGDCTNGVGTYRWPNGFEVTGPWSAATAVAGTYEFRHPCAPSRTFLLTIDANRYPKEGTTIRGCVRSGGKSNLVQYSGTYTTVFNPFNNKTYSTYKTGKYVDAYGIVWDGEFEYIPLRQSVEWSGAHPVIDAVKENFVNGKYELPSGTFVYLGFKIDEEDDEVVRGLYISGPTEPDEVIYLTKARLDYLEKLREDFAASKIQTSEERTAAQKDSGDMFLNILTFATMALDAYSQVKSADLSNRMALDALSRTVRGEKQSPNLPNFAPGMAGSPQSTPKPITVEQYKRLVSGQSDRDRRESQTSTRPADNRQQAAAQGSKPTLGTGSVTGGAIVTGGNISVPSKALNLPPPPTGNEACENANKQTRVPFTEIAGSSSHTEEAACKRAINEAILRRDQKVFLCPQVLVRTSVSIGDCQCEEKAGAGWVCRVNVSSSILPSYMPKGASSGMSK